MKISWACLWRMTDSSSKSCQVAMENNFPVIFECCLANCGEKQDLVVLMLRVAANIVEVPWLRMYLKNYSSSFVTIIFDLMSSTTDNYEVIISRTKYSNGHLYSNFL